MPSGAAKKLRYCPMNEPQKFDWIEFWAHFFFGAIPGAVLGGASWVWLAEDESWIVGLMLVGGGAVLVGLIAGAFTQRFWELFKEWLYWFWP